MTDFVTLPLLNPRGAYDPTVVYNPNDLITYNGVPYYCRVGTIVGQPITPGSDTNTWQLLSVPGEPGADGDQGIPGIQGPPGKTGQPGADGSGYRLRGQWNAATAYSANDSVSYIDANGHYTVIWFAIKDNTNVSPGSDNTVWGAGIKGDTGDVTPEAQAAAAAALASKEAAATSEGNAATSAANALASKNAANTSAGNAATSEGNALTYKNAASTSAQNAATSEGNALASKNAANTSAGNAATSEANALTYKNAANTSAGNAATSEGNALTYANAAAASAGAAAAGSPNLVFNGSGEVGVLGWSGGPTAISASRDGDGAYLSFAANGAPATSAFVSQAFPVKGGKAHTVQADILADAAAVGTYSVDVNYYASADGSGAALFDGGNANLSAQDGAWHHTTSTDAAANVPAGANSARVRLVVTAATWTTLKLRRVKVEQSVTASLYSQETTMAAFGPTPPSNLSPIFQAVSALGKVYAVNSPNLLQNGSGEFGATGWSLPASCAQFNDTGSGLGGYFGNSTALNAAIIQPFSPKVLVGAGAALTWSADLFNSATAGSLQGRLTAYNASNASLGDIALVNVPNGTGWTRYSGTGTTPANTAYVQWNAYTTAAITAPSFGVLWRRVKVEAGSTPSLYSHEASAAAFMNGSVSPSFGAVAATSVSTSGNVTSGPPAGPATFLTNAGVFASKTGNAGTGDSYTEMWNDGGTGGIWMNFPGTARGLITATQAQFASGVPQVCGRNSPVLWAYWSGSTEAIGSANASIGCVASYQSVGRIRIYLSVPFAFATHAICITGPFISNGTNWLMPGMVTNAPDGSYIDIGFVITGSGAGAMAGGQIQITVWKVA